MKSLQSCKELIGCRVHASDGEVGKVRELYFDDARWRVRHIVVEVGHWPRARSVLVEPSAIVEVDRGHRRLVVSESRKQLVGGPDANTDQPVVRQLESRRKSQANWAVTLAGDALTAYPEALQTPEFEPINANGTPFDPHLRSSRAVLGMALRAAGSPAGRIDDLIFDDRSWEVRHLLIDMNDGTRHALPTGLVRRILFAEKSVAASLDGLFLAAGPRLDPSTPFTRQFEEAVRRHFESESTHS